MRLLFPLLFLFAALPAAAGDTKPVIIDHKLKDISGGTLDLGALRGKAVLLVNVASQCGYTPQYKGLEELYKKYKDRGLVVVGVPSNDFGGQEPGTETEIKQFCEVRFGVTFPLAAKVHAKGPEIAPVYKALTQDTPDGIKGDVKWNFTKFLVGKDGKVVKRFESGVKPDSADLTSAVEQVLAH